MSDEIISGIRDTDKNIIPVDIVDEVRKAYLDYAMSVIVSRALPDVRDGLKPVHRRILYTMYENGLTPDKAYRKCADTVGTVLGRYHPHGDASVYDALVRLAQDFSLRYMLVDGHGNFGSVDGYPAAAYRYTEARMSKISTEMLTDIEKDTVDFVSNYDDRLKEPTVLPARFPQLLVNGSNGIAVGMATNIPPHNLGEVIDGMCYLIDHPDAGVDEICQYIKGPDFPTGGIIMGMSGIHAAYSTGRGKIYVRAKTEIEEYKPDRFRIVITELPYMVNKKNLVKSIMDLSEDKKIEGIDDIVDYSNKEGIRIVIEIKSGVSPQVVLNKLFSFTQLQSTFGVIMLALVDNQPKVLTLKEMLSYYIDHQCDVIERRSRFELKKAQERLHILDGLKIALDFIDEVIAILRKSPTVQDGKVRLMDRFGLDDTQAQAIVQMRLGQLTGLEKAKIEEEIESLHLRIGELEEILSSKAKVLDIVKTDALNLRDKYADERRTEITAVEGEVDIEDLIPVEESVLTLTKMGYIKRIPSDEYRLQTRGGRGRRGMTTREEDVASHMFVCSSHDNIVFFSNLGKMYKLKAYEIPTGSRIAKGLAVVNLLPLEAGEKISVMISIGEFDDDKYLIMVTRKGIIKRSALSNYASTRRGGIRAIILDEGDELCWTAVTNGNDDLLVATRDGMSIRFKETDARPLGRTTRGVKAIELAQGDEIVGMAVVDDSKTVLTVTETGYGRRSAFSDYRVQNRGGKGLINYRTAQYGKVASIQAVDENDDILAITAEGIVIRIYAVSVSMFNRPSKGVRVMKVEGDEGRIIAAEKSVHVDDSDDVDETAPEQTADTPAGEKPDGVDEAFEQVMKNAEQRAEEMDEE